MNKIEKKDIRSFSLEKLELFFRSSGERVFRAKQVHKWLWQKGVSSFDEMTNIPNSLRITLAENFLINNIIIDKLIMCLNNSTNKVFKYFISYFFYNFPYLFFYQMF